MSSKNLGDDSMCLFSAKLTILHTRYYDRLSRYLPAFQEQALD